MDFVKTLKPGHLRLTIKIAEFQQLQVAADSLAISQPAASRMLSEVERAADAKLFERHPKGMTPTLAGKAFIRHARSIVDSYESLSAEVAAVRMGSKGEVRIGAVTGPTVQALIPAILKSKETSENLEFTIEVAPSNELMRGLAERRFDFVLSRLPPEYDSRNFKITPARSEQVALAVRDSHPLAQAKNVTLEQLRTFEWVMQERGSPIRKAVEGAFHEAGMQAPERVTNTSSLIVVLALLEQSNSIATLTDEVASLLSSDTIGSKLVILAIKNKIEIPPYNLISNRDVELSTAAENVLREVLARI